MPILKSPYDSWFDAGGVNDDPKTFTPSQLISFGSNHRPGYGAIDANARSYLGDLNEDALRSALRKMNGNVMSDASDNYADMGFEQKMKQAMARGQAGVPTSMADLDAEAARAQPIMPQFEQPQAPMVGQGGGFFNVASDPVPDTPAPAPVVGRGGGVFGVASEEDGAVDPQSAKWRAMRADPNSWANTGERFDPALEQRVNQMLAEPARRQAAAAELRSALNAYKQRTAMQAPQPFSAAAVNPFSGIGQGDPVGAQRRYEGTMPYEGVNANGVQFITDGRLRIPIAARQDAPVAPRVNVGMVGRQGYNLDNPEQAALFNALKKSREENGTKYGGNPDVPVSQQRLLADSRRPDEANMSFEEMMRSRRAASLEKQRLKDEAAATAGQRRHDYANSQIEKRQMALAAGARSIEEAKAKALAERLNAQNPHNPRFPADAMAWQAFNKDSEAWHAAHPNQEMPDDVHNNLRRRNGLPPIGGPVAPPKVAASPPPTTKDNIVGAVQRGLGLRDAPPAPPPSAPWQPDLPPQGSYSGWGNWRGY